MRPDDGALSLGCCPSFPAEQACPVPKRALFGPLEAKQTPRDGSFSRKTNKQASVMVLMMLVMPCAYPRTLWVSS